MLYDVVLATVNVVENTLDADLETVLDRPLFCFLATVSAAVVDFDARSGRVIHVGFRGEATIEPFDEGRTDRLLERYLGRRKSAWDQRFVGLDPDQWGFIRFDPETVVARDQSFVPGLE